MTNRRMMMMLIAMCMATFFITSAGASMAPFLNLIAGDLATTLPTVAHLFSLQALAWGVASLVAGMVSGRLGRRALLVGGILLMGVMRLGFATSESYPAAVTWQILSGIGGGASRQTVASRNSPTTGSGFSLVRVAKTGPKPR